MLDVTVLPVIATSTNANSSCDSPDGGASATADGLTLGYTFQWWDGNTTAGSSDFTGAVYSNISAGDYTVRATNNSTQCTSTALVSVSDQTISPQITGSTTDSNTSCDPFDGEITVTALTPGVVGDYSFAWYMGNNTDPGNLIAGQSAATLTELAPGEYTVVAIHTSTGCSSAPLTLEVTGGCPVAIEDLLDPEVIGLKAVPNPSSQNVSVTFTNQNASTSTVRIFDQQGRLVHTQTTNGDHYTISKRHLSKAGVYVLHLELGHFIYTIKLVRN